MQAGSLQNGPIIPYQDRPPLGLNPFEDANPSPPESGFPVARKGT